MKTIELFEQAATKGNEFFRENNLNTTLYWAYRKSKQNGNEFIDFQEVIWDEDIEPIANFLKAEGINKFTISSLAAFEKQGFHMNGLTKVTADYTDFATGKPKIIPAILMKLN